MSITLIANYKKAPRQALSKNLRWCSEPKASYGGKAAVLQQEIDHINGKLICD